MVYEASVKADCSNDDSCRGYHFDLWVHTGPSDQKLIFHSGFFFTQSEAIFSVFRFTAFLLQRGNIPAYHLIFSVLSIYYNGLSKTKRAKCSQSA